MSEQAKKYGDVEGLKPAFIEGQDPGSTYRVFCRTSRGYIAVRRLSKYVFRVRAERFDNEPLLTVNDTATIVSLNSMRLTIGQDAKRVSGTFYSSGAAYDACAVLVSVLLYSEKDIQNMEHCSDPRALAADAKIEEDRAAHKAKASERPSEPATLALIKPNPDEELN